MNGEESGENYQEQEKEEEGYSVQDERIQPENALDYNMLLVNSVWGTKDINPKLIAKLEKIQGVLVDKDNNVKLDKKGNPTIIKQDLWSTLSFYTRDMRLSNLDSTQFTYCIFYTDLAGDLLRVDMIEPFLVCLSRVATVIELAQSRNGFLRNRQNTLTTEQRIMNQEPPKRSLLTGKESNINMR